MLSAFLARSFDASNGGRWQAIARTLSVPVAIVGLGLAGCSNLTRATNASYVPGSAISTPTGAVQERAAAVTDFVANFSGQAFFSGLLADEFADRSGGAFTGDNRTVTPNNQFRGTSFPYDALSQTRMIALDAIGNLQRYNPSPTWHVGELFAYVAYSELFFAEDMCSGIPIGVLVNGHPQYGSTLTRSQLLQRALADFDSAAHYAAGTDSIVMLAQVGRARALVDSGDFAAASSAVAAIPQGYAFVARFDGNFAINTVHQSIVDFSAASVSDNEGINGLDFASGADPRVPTSDVGPGTGGEIFDYSGYGSDAASMPLATGIEAELIRAEAALAAADVNGWVTMLNDLREHAAPTPIPDLPTDSTTAATRVLQQTVTFRERAFWLFATGHRQGDLRRLVRQYGRPAEGVFPTGLYEGGPALYGRDVTYVPFAEQANASYAGCIDRNP